MQAEAFQFFPHHFLAAATNHVFYVQGDLIHTREGIQAGNKKKAELNPAAFQLTGPHRHHGK
jgi:hypothetical protein